MPTFLLLGSGEFEPWSTEVESLALADAVGDGSVVILPTASASEGDHVFERWGRMGLDHYARSGVSASVIPVKVREDAFNPEVVATVEGASMIYFSGGKPSRLADVLRDSPLLAAIRRAIDRGAVYAGCSAGAMIASRERNAGGRLGTSWLFGLGLVPQRVVRCALGSGGAHPGSAVVDDLAAARRHVVRRHRRANGDPRRRALVDRLRCRACHPPRSHG